MRVNALLKPESRIALGFACRGGYIILVMRGPSRIEYFFTGLSLDEAITHLTSSSIFKEVRAAWPLELAEKTSLPLIDYKGYLGVCNLYIRGLAMSLCRKSLILLSR